MPDSSFGRGSIESDHLEYLWGTILVTGEQISIEIDSDNIVDTSSGFIPGTVGQWNFYDGRIPSRRGNYCCQFFSSIFSFCISLNSNSNVSNKFFFANNILVWAKIRSSHENCYSFFLYISWKNKNRKFVPVMNFLTIWNFETSQSWLNLLTFLFKKIRILLTDVQACSRYA